MKKIVLKGSIGADDLHELELGFLNFVRICPRCYTKENQKRRFLCTANSGHRKRAWCDHFGFALKTDAVEYTNSVCQLETPEPARKQKYAEVHGQCIFSSIYYLIVEDVQFFSLLFCQNQCFEKFTFYTGANSKNTTETKRIKTSPCNKLRIATGNLMLECNAFSSLSTLKQHVLCNDFKSSKIEIMWAL